MKIKPDRPKTVKKIILIVVIFLFVLVLGAGTWVKWQISPVDANNKQEETVKITQSTTFDFLASRLEERGLIKNAWLFKLSAKALGKDNGLKVGACKLSPSQSSLEILNDLTGECKKQKLKVITFFPGATIDRPSFKSIHAKNVDQDKMYIKGILLSAGYSKDEIKRALNKQYSSDLFKDKPKKTTLEGYIYGQTYHLDSEASAEEVLEASFKEMNKQIKKYHIVEGFKKQGLNLYEGITMASIVQRELNCEGKPTKARTEKCYKYLRGISQVLLKRLKEGIKLGSDVTFIYAADKMGVKPRIDLDSPYNTRIKVGLPPGPVGSPGILAMRAVADPAKSDNLFFVAGDDGLIYFSKTNREHQIKTKKYCKKLCYEL